MRYRTLGKSGLRVSAIGFGAWGIGGQWGPVERQTALDTVRAAVDTGVTFFDTADIYGDPRQGQSEELVGEALRLVRDRVLIATKAGWWGGAYHHRLPFTHASHIELCCDASLHRLRTDVIDLYQCHYGQIADPSVFLEAFETLQKRGKIRAYGISTNSVRVARRFFADGRGTALQVDYSYLNRLPENHLLPFCKQNSIGVIARGPLAQGVAAGKFTPASTFNDVRAEMNRDSGRVKFLRQLAVVERLRPMERPGRNLAQLALQFVLSNDAVSVAIPGAKTPEQARANAAAGDAVLSPEELEQVRAAAPVVDYDPGKSDLVSRAKRLAKKVLRRT
jgi:aryl-alcohol dehydrogenase-like predicted oxidoreductase